MRVAIYARVSTDKQSTDMQVHELGEYAKLRGWTVTATYLDQISGTTVERPRLKDLMRDAKSRKFDIVLVWKLDRFGRSLQHLINGLSELEALGIVFVSLKDSLDFSTPGGRFQVQVLAAVAEFEAAMIRERIRSGMARRKASGKSMGRPRTVDRDKVRALSALGHSARHIAREMGISHWGVMKILRSA